METNITKINVGGTLLPVNDPNVCDNFEDGNTAFKTYNAGEFLIWKGSLYKVTTTIAQGATFTDEVNLEDATITELLEAVNTALNGLHVVVATVDFGASAGTTNVTLGTNIIPAGKQAFALAAHVVNKGNNYVNQLPIGRLANDANTTHIFISKENVLNATITSDAISTFGEQTVTVILGYI